MTIASLRAMDSSLEESAQMSGASLLQTLRRVTLPLAFPSLLAAALYTLTIGISAFDIPLIIGMSNRIFTFSTYLYMKTNPQAGLPEYGLPGGFRHLHGGRGAVAELVVQPDAGAGAPLPGGHGQELPAEAGAAPRLGLPVWVFIGAYILLAKLLPLLLLIWAALLPYLQPPSLAALGTLSLKQFSSLPGRCSSAG